MEPLVDRDLVVLYASWPVEARVDHAVATQEMYLDLHRPFDRPEVLLFSSLEEFAAYHRSEAWRQRIYGAPPSPSSAVSSTTGA